MPRPLPVGDAPLSEAEAAEQLVWDLPVRLVHWLLAALIAFSWWSVHNHHTDWHIWSGIAILTVLLFRLFWGFVGSSTARWSTFIRGPRVIASFLQGQWRGIGHNPLAALSVLALFGAVAVQVGLGVFAQDEDGLYFGPLSRLVSSDTSDRIASYHETWFNVILGLVGLHLAAIVIYRLRGQKLTRSMITGRAAVDPTLEPMQPGKWWVAIICLAVALGISRWVVAGAPPFGS